MRIGSTKTNRLTAVDADGRSVDGGPGEANPSSLRFHDDLFVFGAGGVAGVGAPIAPPEPTPLGSDGWGGGLPEAVPLAADGWEDVAEILGQAFGAASIVLSGAAAGIASAAGAGSVLTSYESGRSASLFNIHIDFKGSLWTADLQRAFIRAVDVVESVIRADVQNASIRVGATVKAVDDIAIDATLANIDGAGAILGQAAPTWIRAANHIPVAGTMTFDLPDVQRLASSVYAAPGSNGTRTESLWDVTVLHEMLHCLGVGSLWALDKLATVKNGVPVYTGKAAGLEHAKMLNPAARSAVDIPLETTGGGGTAGVHWSEARFKSELMTGYLNNSYDPISKMTAASLGDLGYGLSPQAQWHVDQYALG